MKRVVKRCEASEENRPAVCNITVRYGGSNEGGIRTGEVECKKVVGCGGFFQVR
jgi:hypothetical protein